MEKQHQTEIERVAAARFLEEENARLEREAEDDTHSHVGQVWSTGYDAALIASATEAVAYATGGIRYAEPDELSEAVEQMERSHMAAKIAADLKADAWLHRNAARDFTRASRNFRPKPDQEDAPNLNTGEDVEWEKLAAKRIAKQIRARRQRSLARDIEGSADTSNVVEPARVSFPKEPNAAIPAGGLTNGTWKTETVVPRLPTSEPPPGQPHKFWWWPFATGVFGAAGSCILLASYGSVAVALGLGMFSAGMAFGIATRWSIRPPT